MGAQGTTTVDFGAFPGVTDATAVVTGQTGITGTSLAEAWLLPADTADHTIDEHIVEDLDLFCKSIVAGTGFTIHAICRTGLAYGLWNVAWVWN